MITLPYMYGTIFYLVGDGKYRTFRVGTHGKEEITGKDAIKQYLSEPPLNRLYHKMTVTDNMIFIADEVYQPDERLGFHAAGYATALLGWKRIIEWAHREKILNSLKFSSDKPLSTLVFMNTNILDQLYINDSNDGKALDENFYDTVNLSQNGTYLNIDVNLNKLDVDGYPSWRDASTGGHREVTYSSVVCYTGLYPNIPSFTNNDNAESYTYMHREETADEKLPMAWMSFYNATPGVVGKTEYRSFVTATMLQTPLHVRSLNKEGWEIVWTDPNIDNGVRVVKQDVTKEYLEAISGREIEIIEDNPAPELPVIPEIN